MSDRVRPFHCGSQYMDWLDRNCDRCTKGYDHERQESHCEIEEAMSFACIDDGCISTALARRCGITEETRTHYTWDCPEREPLGAHPEVPAYRPAKGQLELFSEAVG